MTEKQRKHSKLYGEIKRDKTLISEPGDVEIRISVHLGRIPGKMLPSTQAEYLEKLICDADTVVIAKIKNKTSQITENLEFVFTDYELDIREVLKNDSNLDILTSRSATLTVAGGSVKVDKRTIKIILERDNPLLVGREYLLFLRYINDSESFKVSSERGILGIFDKKIKFPQNLYKNTVDDAEGIVSSIRSAVTNCSTLEGGK
jgi:hypothetical protein